MTKSGEEARSLEIDAEADGEGGSGGAAGTGGGSTEAGTAVGQAAAGAVAQEQGLQRRREEEDHCGTPWACWRTWSIETPG